MPGCQPCQCEKFQVPCRAHGSFDVSVVTCKPIHAELTVPSMFLLCRATRLTYNLVRALNVFRPTRTKSTSSRNSPRHCTYVCFPAGKLHVEFTMSARSESREPKLQESCLQVRRVRLRQQRHRSAGSSASSTRSFRRVRLRQQRHRSAGSTA